MATTNASTKTNKVSKANNNVPTTTPAQAYNNPQASKRKPKWTTIEDDILCTNIRKHPNNISAALKQTSIETGRTVGAVAGRWYAHVSKDTTHTYFITISGKHKAINRKNGKGEPVKVNLFQRILKILGLNF